MTTPLTTPGLSKIYEELQQIKQAMGNDIQLVSGFVGNAVQDITTAQYAKLATDISNFVNGFKQNLPANIDAYNDVVQLCSYAVNYVEQFAGQFAALKSTSVTSDFKLDTAIKLIKEVTTKFDDVFLTKTINHLVKIQYPPKKTPPTPPPSIQRQPSVIKSVGKKSGKFLLGFMKK